MMESILELSDPVVMQYKFTMTYKFSLKNLATVRPAFKTLIKYNDNSLEEKIKKRGNYWYWV